MMSDISLSSLNIKDFTSPQATNNKSTAELDQEDFFALLVAQLENQDPLEPQDNTAFVAQLAQFGTLDSTQRLQRSFEDFVSTAQSSQALQASALVGRKVTLNSAFADLVTGQPVNAAVELTEPASNVTASIYNQAGQLIRQFSLNNRDAGWVNFSWDGLNESGTAVPQGRYVMQALGEVRGEQVQFTTAVQANVDSVTLGSATQGTQGLTLNVAGVGPVPFESVREINE